MNSLSVSKLERDLFVDGRVTLFMYNTKGVAQTTPLVPGSSQLRDGCFSLRGASRLQPYRPYS